MSDRLVDLPALTADELLVLIDALDFFIRDAHKPGYITGAELAERIAVARSLRTAVAEALATAMR